MDGNSFRVTPRTNLHIRKLSKELDQRKKTRKNKLLKMLSKRKIKPEKNQKKEKKKEKTSEKEREDKKLERVRDQLFCRITKSPAKSKELSKIFESHKKIFQREIFPPLIKKGHKNVYEITSSPRSRLINDNLNNSRFDSVDYQPEMGKPKGKFRKTFLVNKKNGGLSYTKNDYENYKLSFNKFIRHKNSVTTKMVNKAMPKMFKNMVRNMKKKLDIFSKKSNSVDESVNIEKRRMHIRKKFMSRVKEISMMVKSRLKGKDLNNNLIKYLQLGKRSNSLSFDHGRNSNRRRTRNRTLSRVKRAKKINIERMINTYSRDDFKDSISDSFQDSNSLDQNSKIKFKVTGRKIDDKNCLREASVDVRYDDEEDVEVVRKQKIRKILEVSYNEDSKKKWNRVMGQRLGKQKDFERQFIPIGIENGKRIIIELK